MEIYLVRHGIAEDLKRGMEDADRKLTDEGREKALKVAQVFCASGAKPDIIVHSPLVRARETAEIFANEFSVSMKMIAGLRPEDSPRLQEIGAIAQSGKNVMVVGHEPNLSILAALLLGAGQPFFSFKKAGIAGFEWAGPNRCYLMYLLQPKFLLDAR